MAFFGALWSRVPSQVACFGALWSRYLRKWNTPKKREWFVFYNKEQEHITTRQVRDETINLMATHFLSLSCQPIWLHCITVGINQIDSVPFKVKRQSECILFTMCVIAVTHVVGGQFTPRWWHWPSSLSSTAPPFENEPPKAAWSVYLTLWRFTVDLRMQ